MLVSRADRLAEQLQREIAMIIHRELKDPRLGFVTIMRVELSKDLSHAKVFFSCLGGADERRRCQHALDRGVRFVYGLLKKRLRLRITPALVFQYDASIAESLALEQMLDRLRRPDAG